MADYAYQQKKANYSAKPGAAAVHQPRTARARIMGVNASWKDLCNVCSNVRGWATDDALDFLGKAAIGEKAILFTSHSHGKGHRRELGGKKGGWPMKSVKIVLGVLENAVANANRLGLGSTKVAHIIANKQNTYPRMSPKGRRIVHNYETAFVEIVLEEVQESAGAKKGKKAGKPAGKKPVAQKTEEEIKKQEMSSTDKHRPIEDKKLGTVQKEAQRI